MSLLMLVMLLAAEVQRPATLGAELLSRNLPAPPDAADLEQPITSYSTLDDERGFAIAYYGVEPDGRLHDLRVRTYDAATRTWRKWTRAEPIGSVVGLQRGGRFLFLTGHVTPSASALLVLTETLEMKRELNGWPQLVLPGGRIVFARSMMHFAPTHAAALALYDPSTDREISLYPHAAVKNQRGGEKVPGTELWMDRTIGAVTLAPDGTIVFPVTEQRMRLHRDLRGIPVGPAERATVVCTIETPQPVCSRKRQAGSGKLLAGSG